jgi:hypothetical protein
MLPVDPSSAATQVLAAAAGGVNPGFQATMADIWGGLIGDRIHQWRQRNLINVLEKTAKHLEGKGIGLAAARPLPDGEIYQIFDGASKTEGPTLQELWSKLLASRLDGETPADFVRTIASTLQQMSEVDAVVLVFLDDEPEILYQVKRTIRAAIDEEKKTRRFDPRNWEEYWKALRAREAELIEPYLADVLSRLSERKLSDRAELEISKHNLLRLGLIRIEEPSAPSLSTYSISRSYDEDEGPDPIEELRSAVNHFNDQFNSVESWASENAQSDRNPLWRFNGPVTAEILYELTPLGEHLMGKVKLSE